MEAITSDEMKKLEDFAAGLGIPARILMEIAGMKVANIAVNEIKRVNNATIICGSGGNGGDGFVAAKYLVSSGIKTDVFLTSPAEKISSNDSIANLTVLKSMGVKVIELNEGNIGLLKTSLMGTDIVIDAVYGIGFKGEVKGLESKIFDLVNSTKSEIKDRRPYYVLAVDVPSGVNASTGEVSPQCIEADATVTFEYPKIGLFKYPASRFAGKILTTSIGIPKPNPVEPQVSRLEQKKAATEKMEGIQITDPRQVSSSMPRWKVDAHKGDRGKVLVIGGSSGMMGAAVLTANSALRSGSGLVTLCVPNEIKNFVNSMSLEVVVSGFDRMEEKLKDCDAIAVGPGLSNGGNVKQIMTKLLTGKIKVPIVIDADGLNAISDPEILKKPELDIVITPHPGEFSRLLGKSVDEIQKDRMGFASRFAVEYGVTVVLKGAYTVIAGREKQIFINPTGNPGMATAGSGDVLTGIIAGLIGQGMKSFDAAVAGAYIHGMAANMASSIKGIHGIVAGDIIDSVPYTIDSIM